MKLRAPAVPLITIDPFFSVWSCADRLNQKATCHWTGHTNTLNGYLTVDGALYRFMGGEEAGGIPMQQTAMDITALATVYTFEAAGVRLNVRFFSPLFADDLYLSSRPVSYLELKAESTDGKKHTVNAEVRASEELCLDAAREEPITTEKGQLDNISVAKMGSVKQNVIAGAGDDTRISWGYFYLCVRAGQADFTKVRGETFATAKIALNNNQHALFAFAYDDIESIEYFHKRLKGYWTKNGKTIEEAIREAFSDYDALTARETIFSDDLTQKATEAGGEQYADMLSLAYRQVMAAHKLVEDDEDGLLFISKECLSNGCAATVDVSYPSMPMLLYYNPELVNAMLRPVFRYSESEAWPFDFAPHDVGTYPILNGQSYSNGTDPEMQMPIEECGNMLVMAAAAAVAQKDAALFVQHKKSFKQWADYLVAHGVDPESQRCTDDFFKHLPHNCNLSVKAIMGVASMARLLRMSGDAEEADSYMKTAQEMAQNWVKRADNGDGCFRLAFDQPDTFSLKYNMVWDKLFGTHLFPENRIKSEFASYWQYANPYGITLDCRGTTSKTDWLCWTATLADTREEFARFIAPVWRFFNETENRVPMSDWYSTKTAARFYSQNRTVQGGLFIKLLEQSGKCHFEEKE